MTAGAAPSAKPGGVAPKLEVIYRDPLTSNVTLVAGSFPPPSSLGSRLDIAVTAATAARFGLHPGSVLKLAVNNANRTGDRHRDRPPADARLGVLERRRRRPGAVATTCRLRRPACPRTGRARCSPIPASSPRCRPPSVSSPCSSSGSSRSASAACRPDQVAALEQSLNHAAGAVVTMSGDLAGAAVPLTVQAELLTQLTAFTLTDTAVEQVLSLLFVSLTVVGAAVLLLAGADQRQRAAPWSSRFFVPAAPRCGSWPR